MSYKNRVFNWAKFYGSLSFWHILAVVWKPEMFVHESEISLRSDQLSMVLPLKVFSETWSCGDRAQTANATSRRGLMLSGPGCCANLEHGAQSADGRSRGEQRRLLSKTNHSNSRPALMTFMFCFVFFFNFKILKTLRYECMFIRTPQNKSPSSGSRPPTAETSAHWTPLSPLPVSCWSCSSSPPHHSSSTVPLCRTINSHRVSSGTIYIPTVITWWRCYGNGSTTLFF